MKNVLMFAVFVIAFVMPQESSGQMWIGNGYGVHPPPLHAIGGNFGGGFLQPTRYSYFESGNGTLMQQNLRGGGGIIVGALIGVGAAALINNRQKKATEAEMGEMRWAIQEQNQLIQEYRAELARTQRGGARLVP